MLKNFEVIAEMSHGQNSMHVLMKREYVIEVTEIETDTITCGSMYLLNDKNAIKISFNFGGKKLCFINC